jgi:ribose transport system permease protein
VQPDSNTTVESGHASVTDVVGLKQHTLWQTIRGSQSFWVAMALIALMVVMTAVEPSFGTPQNLTNVTRNFAPFGIMALGMTLVIITGGIDLSIGSIMGLVAIIAGLLLTAHYPWYVAFAAGLLTGLACGVVNGFFVAYVGMPSFVVTLGMLSIARSLAVVFSGNQMLYQFGPDAPIVKAIGQSKWPLRSYGWMPSWLPELSSHFWLMLLLALILGYVFNFTAWARHLMAIGGNENAARLTGVPVNWVKFQTYVFSALSASVASLLLLGYNGSAINALGQGYELRVIAAVVIGGASLMGGSGTAFGAIIGAAFLEVIRNALLMAGIDSNWQGTFVGALIIFAVLIGMRTPSGKPLVTEYLERLKFKT